MDDRYRITLARSHDLSALAEIEIAAATLLRDHAPASVLNEVTEQADLLEAQGAGRLWVALADDATIGFALVEMLAADAPHLEEMSVHPAHGRRGVGTALLREVCAWTVRSGYPALSLTTFRNVPWNMPFYARAGFEEIPPSELSAGLVAIVKDEAERGLDPRRRVVMRYRAPS
jgi:GNAT superfamily N-acetyltransferase